MIPNCLLKLWNLIDTFKNEPKLLRIKYTESVWQTTEKLTVVSIWKSLFDVSPYISTTFRTKDLNLNVFQCYFECMKEYAVAHFEPVFVGKEMLNKCSTGYYCFVMASNINGCKNIFATLKKTRFCTLNQLFVNLFPLSLSLGLTPLHFLNWDSYLPLLRKRNKKANREAKGFRISDK